MDKDDSEFTGILFMNRTMQGRVGTHGLFASRTRHYSSTSSTVINSSPYWA